jgi:GNAT superfamily N-acetyltransferase
MFEDLHLKIRILETSDYPQLKALMDSIYDGIGGAWPEHTIFKLMDDLPEGKICLVDLDTIVRVALSVQVNYLRFSNPHTYDDLISAKETILNDSAGDALYGLDVLIHKDCRGFRLGRRLYEARKELCRQHSLRAILAGGRIPNYYQHSDEISPPEYIEAVDHKRIYTSVIRPRHSFCSELYRAL